MMVRPVLTTAALTAIGFLLGTALHEATHWLAARIADVEVERVSLLPPNPEVVFRRPTPGVDAAIKASTVVAAPGVLSLSFLAFSTVYPASLAWLPVGLAVGYLPRSQTDWGGVRSLANAIR